MLKRCDFMKFQLKLFIIIAISMLFLAPITIEAKTTNEGNQLNKVSTYVQIAKKSTKKTSKTSTNVDDLGKSFDSDAEADCNSLLGNPKNEDSVAWLVVKILTYMRILGPLAVIVLSGIEFTKTIVLSDDEAMKKAINHLTTRLILVAVLFLVPTIVQVLLQVFNVISDPLCGIE